MTVLTPPVLLPAVWPLPLSLATTRGISVDFSSSGYLDVSVPRVPRVTLCVHVTLRGSSPRVFPHSEICGSKLICSSPQLIAACHVLHRLPMPRHSPYALLRLNYLRISVSGILVLLLELLCFILAVLLAKLFFYPTEKPDLLIMFPCFLSCMSHEFFRIHMISLIRFSMSMSPAPVPRRRQAVPAPNTSSGTRTT